MDAVFHIRTKDTERRLGRMVDRENIIFNRNVYYTPSWTGIAKIAILAAYDKGWLLVQAKDSPFIRIDDYVFDEPGKARKALKQWKNYERKRKKLEKGRKNAKKNNYKKNYMMHFQTTY